MIAHRSILVVAGLATATAVGCSGDVRDVKLQGEGGASEGSGATGGTDPGAAGGHGEAASGGGDTAGASASGGGTPSGSGGLEGATGGGGGTTSGSGGTAGATGGGGGTTAGSGGTGIPDCEPRSTDGDGIPVIVANAENNYTYSSSVSAEEIRVAPRADYHLDWSGVQMDLRGHPVDPLTDIDRIEFILWNLTPAEVQAGLNANSLSQSDTALIGTIETQNDTTDGHMSDFLGVGEPIATDTLMDALDPTVYDPATHTWTIIAAEGTQLGLGTRMVATFRVDPAASNTEIVLDSDSAQLDYDVDLQSLEPIRIPVGDPDHVLDWTELVDNAMGRPFNPEEISEVVVAKYSLGLGQLEAQFLDLDLLADELYHAERTSFDGMELSSLTSSSGAPFAGIDDSGTWLLALACSVCANPAPLYLTVLRPCTPP